MSYPELLIAFNGPPGSGKDTAAIYAMAHLQHVLRVKTVLDRYSMPLKLALKAATGWSLEQIDEFKGKNHPLAFGMDTRKLQIGISEDVFKAEGGPEIFGQLFVHRNAMLAAQHDVECIVVPDAGFPAETLHVMQAWRDVNILFVRLHRTGRDFAADSRSLVSLNKEADELQCGYIEVDVDNNGTHGELAWKVINVVDNWVRRIRVREAGSVGFVAGQLPS
jgi:hypothetical protein